MKFQRGAACPDVGRSSTLAWDLQRCFLVSYPKHQILSKTRVLNMILEKQDNFKDFYSWKRVVCFGF